MVSGQQLVNVTGSVKRSVKRIYALYVRPVITASNKSSLNGQHNATVARSLAASGQTPSAWCESLAGHAGHLANAKERETQVCTATVILTVYSQPSYDNLWAKLPRPFLHDVQPPLIFLKNL